MKRMVLLVAAAILCLGLAIAMQAQSDAWVGTWKLNIEKSKFASMPGPKSLTRTLEAQGDGMKYTFDGTAGDGSALGYSFTLHYDGKDNPITGSGMPFGANSIAAKHMGPKIVVSTLKKDGTIVAKAKTEVSADGKSTKLIYLDPAGKPTGAVAIYDKQ